MEISSHKFEGCVAALGTMHQKEKVIAPLFKKELGIIVKVPDDLDTDSFGTFTMDKKRMGSQKEAAVLKAKTAMNLLGVDIGIASEGSFGPHPAAPFGIANIELVVFIDTKLNLEIFGGHIEVVNFAHTATAHTVDEVLEFARKIDFPKYAVVMRRTERNYGSMAKSIVDKDILIETATSLFKKYSLIWLETDLRAHVNQSRMKNIELATIDLIENIKRECPNCHSPGFHKITPKPGLPCKTCGRPTNIALYDVYECSVCAFTKDVMYPGKKETAYAGYCDYCNP
jgi:hypothetical protein